MGEGGLSPGEVGKEIAEHQHHADDYVRTTVFLATVLFLVGISGHFRVRGARYGLVGLGTAILVVSVGILLTLPRTLT